MNSPPLITVVVPTYNAAGFIGETLGSVLGQSFEALEIIVVDDGSTDDTCRIADNMDRRVRLIKQSRAGVCVARNRGLKEARGRYICFLDHDDVWHRHKLEAQLAVFLSDPEVALVHTDYKVWIGDADGRYAPAASLLEAEPGRELDDAASGWVYHHLLVDSFILTSTAMLRTETVREVGGFDPALPYSEDWDLWLRLSRQWRFSKLKGRYALYRQLPTQGSRRYREVDYRTRLLEDAVAKWGISSPDGQTHGAAAVRRQLARFHVGYGFECLRVNAVGRARQALWRGWRCDPRQAKYLAYLAAVSLGWRPSW